MSTVDLFTNQGQDLRVVTVDGEPWFIAGDVCSALDITNVGNALARLDDDEKGSIRLTDGTAGNPNKGIVSEAGLYTLVLRSDKAEAKSFKRWVTHEVLPQIRKTGRYGAPVALPSKAELAQWVIDAEEKAAAAERARVEAEQRAFELEAPASAWSHMVAAAGDYAVDEAAKALSRDATISIGRNRLFSFMAAEGWIYRHGARRQWHAYQTQVDTGRLVEKLSGPFLNHRTGDMEVPAPTIRVTPKGLAELHKRLGGSGQLVPVGVAS